MRFSRYWITICIAGSMICSLLQAQQAGLAPPSVVVPRLVNFSGTATDAQGKVISGIAGATFAIYKDQYEGAPLWLETQNLQTDAKGNYTAQLGATKPDGLPMDLFTSGEARWLGVTVNGGQEQPRTLLLSVPYALKAADAETVGGFPPSAFVLSNSSQAASQKTLPATSIAASKSIPPPANPPVTGKGTVGFIPAWDSASDILNSIIFQKSSHIGIGTSAPAATIDINGKGDVRDTLTLFPKGTDPTLAVNGTTFVMDQTGKITFVAGQTFPGTGTITGVTAGTDLTGGGTTGNVTLKLDTTKVPLLNSVNTFTGNQGVVGTVTVTGSVGVGTTGPQASLDVFSSTAGNHAPIGKFGSSGSGDCNSVLTYTGSGTAEIFSSGGFGCFIPGTQPGDSGMRVSPGNRILLGDSTANRVLVDSVGNVEQQRYAGGMVKGMIHFSPFNGGRIITCFNFTLSGAPATTPPCGFTYDITGVGDYIFDFGFEVDDRVYSVASGSQSVGSGLSNPISVDACGNQDGQCIHSSILTNNQVEVAAFNVSDASFSDSKIHLIIY